MSDISGLIYSPPVLPFEQTAEGRLTGICVRQPHEYSDPSLTLVSSESRIP